MCDGTSLADTHLVYALLSLNGQAQVVRQLEVVVGGEDLETARVYSSGNLDGAGCVGGASPLETRTQAIPQIN